MSYTDTERLEFIMRRKELPAQANPAIFGKGVWTMNGIPYTSDVLSSPRECIDHAMQHELMDMLTK
jgi:hypothetical protein